MCYKYIFLFIVVLILPFNSILSQIQIGEPVDKNCINFEINQEQLNELKEIKVFFVCRDNDDPEELEKLFKTVWTFNEIKVVKYSELEKNASSDNSYISIEGYQTPQNKLIKDQRGHYHNIPLKDQERIKEGFLETRLEFWKLSRTFRDEGYITKFSTIELYFRSENYPEIGIREREVREYLYNNGEFYNWTPGQLKNYLRLINEKLHKREGMSSKNKIIKEEIHNLTSSKLFIPEYILKFISLKKNAKSILHKKYGLPFEIISKENLSEKINNKDDIYYLEYIKSGSEKYFLIISNKSGEIIYRSNLYPTYYNFKLLRNRVVESKVNQTKS